MAVRSSGWGKLHHLDRITSFFKTLNISFLALNAHLASGLEFIGGILPIVGFGARLTALLLTGNMLVAYWIADRKALYSVFSDPGKFYVADPYVLVFGAGLFSGGALLVTRCRAWIERQ